jgi:hypothetical protein
MEKVSRDRSGRDSFLCACKKIVHVVNFDRMCFEGEHVTVKDANFDGPVPLLQYVSVFDRAGKQTYNVFEFFRERGENKEIPARIFGYINKIDVCSTR